MTADLEIVKEIRDNCIGLLTRREHSQRELLDKLKIKGFDCSITQLVIDKLESEGWQSDIRFAESYARHRIKKGFGPVRITYELQQRGVVDFDLELVILDLSGSWYDQLKQVYAKKYDGDPSSQKEWIKRSRFLQQRGFNHEMIRTLLKY